MLTVNVQKFRNYAIVLVSFLLVAADRKRQECRPYYRECGGGYECLDGKCYWRVADPRYHTEVEGEPCNTWADCNNRDLRCDEEARRCVEKGYPGDPCKTNFDCKQSYKCRPSSSGVMECKYVAFD